MFIKHFNPNYLQDSTSNTDKSIVKKMHFLLKKIRGSLTTLLALNVFIPMQSISNEESELGMLRQGCNYLEIRMEWGLEIELSNEMT